MLSWWLVSATPSSGLYTLCPMASTRGARGVTLVVARRGPEGRARKRVLYHDADSDLRDFFCGQRGACGAKRVARSLGRTRFI